MVRYANPAAAKMLGYNPEELPGLDYRVLINTHEDGDTRSDPVRKVRYTTDMMRGVGALLRRKNGQYRPVEYRILPVTEHGVSVGTVLVFHDVSERVRLDNLLKEMQTTARIGGWEYDVLTRAVHLTEALYAICELPLNQRLDTEALKQRLSPEDQRKLDAAARKAMERGTDSDLHVQFARAGGRKLWARVIIKGERRGGQTVRLHGTVQDVTELVVAERQLRETRDFYELTLNAVPTPISYISRELVVTYANRALEDWLGAARSEMLGKPAGEVFADSIETAHPHIDTVFGGEAVHVRQSGLRNGIMREWQIHLVPQLDASGTVMGFFSIVYDLTEQKRLESRLLQAQKMEAIGQLTGGIAHDFNNLLGVVIGNLQLLERSIAETPTLARKVHTAMRAAIRGADLTRRLLAFARREILDPAVLDLNRQLSGLTELMQRTIGDSIDVRMVQAPGLWHTLADAGQFENVILNLAINARDAMPEGGRLTVRTKNTTLDALFCSAYPQIEPGEFVSVSVSDTGSGIEPEVLKRVFEPFFTTKESGKGSGLGLAMVHGFAEQAGGIATIQSTPRSGTTVTILLPRCHQEQQAYVDTIVTKFAPGGDETILVVEDDADLRETVVTALEQLGYRALAAANAAAALRVLSGGERIDLLFTDVMMPGGMLGPALAKRARELRPQIGVLFTTGYAENAVLAGTAGLTSADIISKPYRNEDLAMRIRYVLDRETRIA
jgi:PAS domain S-box-containing protein